MNNTEQAKSNHENNRQAHNWAKSDYDVADTKEGQTTKQIESVTKKIPSGFFLSCAVTAMAASALLQLAGRKQTSQFIGQWAPTILILGLYNKLVKLEGAEPNIK